MGGMGARAWNRIRAAELRDLHLSVAELRGQQPCVGPTRRPSSPRPAENGLARSVQSLYSEAIRPVWDLAVPHADYAPDMGVNVFVLPHPRAQVGVDDEIDGQAEGVEPASVVPTACSRGRVRPSTCARCRSSPATWRPVPSDETPGPAGVGPTVRRRSGGVRRPGGACAAPPSRPGRSSVSGAAPVVAPKRRLIASPVAVPNSPNEPV